MRKMGLFGKKCEYCRNKIKKGKEYQRAVKVRGFVGTSTKNFCSEEHADSYEKEIEAMPKQSGRSCCG